MQSGGCEQEDDDKQLLTRLAEKSFKVTLAGKSLPSAHSRYAHQYFPVRNVKNAHISDGGAWLVEYKTLKQQDVNKSLKRQSYKDQQTTELTSFYLVKQCYVEQPEDICILNISGKCLSQAPGEDFSLFKNVVHIDASDNSLPLESFCTFPSLEHLELQVNNITSFQINHQDFAQLKNLDLSYNTLSEQGLLNLGKLRNVFKLSLRGCGLKSLPSQLARGYQVSDSDSDDKKMKADKKTRFPKLNTLDLSENELTDISTFASLAGLRRLRELNLSCNKISGVPHLRLMAAHRQFSLSTFTGSEGLRDDLPQEQSNGDADVGGGDDVRHNVSHNVSEMTPRRNDENATHLYKGETETLMEEEDEDEEEEEEEEDDVLGGIDETISRISSNKDAEETNQLLSMNFAHELNFSLNIGQGGKHEDCVGGDGGEEVGREEKYDAITDELPDPFATADNELLDEDLRRPFACLETMDLSYNQISQEESLLALASWPTLYELKLWGNPLMRACKGIPPIIGHHLKTMCGINIIRKEPRPQPRQLPIAPGIVRSTRARKVKDELPPIKRNNMLMIENMILKAIESHNSQGEHNEKAPGAEHAQEIVPNGKSGGLGVENSDALPPQNGESVDNFFLTQVNEEGVELGEEFPQEYSPGHTSEHGDVEDENEKDETMDKISDYSALLQVDDEVTDFLIPDTVQGSVNALRHMLKNELVFNKGHYNKSKQQVAIHQQPLKKTARRDDVGDALDAIRLIDNSHEENLAIVLEDYKDDSELRKRFPQAKEMMKKVQKKYDNVRLNSLRPLSEAQQNLKKLSTQADRHSQQLVLSRMRQGKIGDLYNTSRGNTPRIKIRGTRYDEVT